MESFVSWFGSAQPADSIIRSPGRDAELANKKAAADSTAALFFAVSGALLDFHDVSAREKIV